MGERGFKKKTNLTFEGWEESDFPILCETCLGDNPYVRMIKMPFGSACHICSRPYTVFRWKAGQEARYKKTVLCQSCSKSKNVCQCCILDLIYGLPVQVRDSFVSKTINNYNGAGNNVSNAIATIGGKAGLNDELLKIARVQPYYKRNLAKTCSFYARGECNRGSECPYRHEIMDNSDNTLANQKYENRYYGKNDPVGNKILKEYNVSQQQLLLQQSPQLASPDQMNSQYPSGTNINNTNNNNANVNNNINPNINQIIPTNNPNINNNQGNQQYLSLPIPPPPPPGLPPSSVIKKI